MADHAQPAAQSPAMIGGFVADTEADARFQAHQRWLAWRRRLRLIRRRFAGTFLRRRSVRFGFPFGFLGSFFFFGLCFFRHKVWQ